MKFKMNDRTFIIRKVSKNEMWGDAGQAKSPNENYFGRFMPYEQEIWLSEDLSPEQEIVTLIHELTHCYIWAYMSPLESCNEEDICYVSANSHIIINRIVSDYIRRNCDD